MLHYMDCWKGCDERCQQMLLHWANRGPASAPEDNKHKIGARDINSTRLFEDELQIGGNMVAYASYSDVFIDQMHFFAFVGLRITWCLFTQIIALRRLNTVCWEYVSWTNTRFWSIMEHACSLVQVRGKYSFPVSSKSESQLHVVEGLPMSLWCFHCLHTFFQVPFVLYFGIMEF